MTRRCRWAARAAALAVLLIPMVAGAAPHGVRLTFYDDPSTTMAVSWNSDAAADTEIVYGPAPTDLPSSATATAIVQDAPLYNTFTVRLSGLTPNTTYFYRVGHAGAYYPAAGSDPFQFTTMSSDPCDPITFVVIGDNRADFDGPGVSALWAGILDEAMAYSPDFFVNTGDMVKNGDAPGEWAAFIDASESGWAYVPSILTLGNHDHDALGLIYKQLYELGTNSTTGDEQYYGLDVGPVHFASVDSNLNGTEFTDMVGWLDADLGATSQPWKIVFNHHALYSRGNHSSGEEDGGYINAGLIPVFDAHDVDWVFSGHSHNYERYAPSVGVDVEFGGTGRTFPGGNASAFPPPTPVPDGATGTSYMVSGGAGSLTTEIFGTTCLDAACTLCGFLGDFYNGCPAEVYGNDIAGNITYDGAHNFALFTINAGEMTVQVYQTATGNVGGAGLIETFSMSSSDFPTDRCAVAPGADAGPQGAVDAGPNQPADAGPNQGFDAGANAPDSGHGAGGEDSGGCGCETGRSSSRRGALLLLVAVVLIARRRR